MGSWNYTSFGNDAACDWVAQLEQTDDLSLVEETLDGILGAGNDYIEGPAAEEAIAAVEVIARLQGHWGNCDDPTEEVDEWVKAQPLIPSNLLAQKARAAIDRIRGERSELPDLWRDSDDYEKWVSALDDLKCRIVVD